MSLQEESNLEISFLRVLRKKLALGIFAWSPIGPANPPKCIVMEVNNPAERSNLGRAETQVGCYLMGSSPSCSLPGKGAPILALFESQNTASNSILEEENSST